MSTPLNSAVRLNEPQDVLAAVPHLLGFTPTDSLVVISVRHARTVPRFGLTMRVDLPPPEHHYSLADYLLNGPLRNQEAEAVLLNVVGSTIDPTPDRPPPDPSTLDRSKLPHQDLIAALREILGGAGIAVLHACWTPKIQDRSPWLCYDDELCRGETPDPKTSPVAAAMAAAGVVTFDSRAELQGLVAADPPDMVGRRAAKLDALAEDLDNDQGSAFAAKRDLDTVFNAIRRTAEGCALTEDDQLRVLLALSDHRVRDLALGVSLGEWAQPAEQLWLTLVRMAPAPELAEVAALLAFSAYLRGEGALASVALERIEEVRPDHRLGKLLRQALDRGVSSTDLGTIARDAAEDARIMLEEDGGWA